MSSASSYRSQADVEADAAILDNPKVVRCAENDIRTSARQQLNTNDITVNFKVTTGSSGGPENIVGTVTSTVTAARSGQRVTIHQTGVLITGSLLEAQVNFVGINQVLSPSEIASYAKIVADRVANA